ncbi:MAG: hypothetical protein EA417_07040 [Gammaproteobacteria bacterium]|nr:MAG: hypothetical protein EA417_07040 [Gammaproteobacteria bacterium]
MTLQRQLPALLLLALTIAIGGCLTSDDLASGPEDTAGAPGPNGGGNGGNNGGDDDDSGDSDDSGDPSDDNGGSGGNGDDPAPPPDDDDDNGGDAGPGDDDDGAPGDDDDGAPGDDGNAGAPPDDGGTALKGPFAEGSEVTAVALAADGSPTGTPIHGVTDARGNFRFSDVPWSGPSMVTVTGQYFDETTGNMSADTLSLRSALEAEDGVLRGSVNLFTHILARYIDYWMPDGWEYDDLKYYWGIPYLGDFLGFTVAPEELTFMAALEPEINRDSTLLLLYSVGFVSAGLDQQAIDRIAQDFAESDGWLTGEGIADFQAWMSAIDDDPEDIVARAIERLQAQYGMSVPTSFPGFVNWGQTCDFRDGPRVCLGPYARANLREDLSLEPGEEILYRFVPPVTGSYNFGVSGSSNITWTLRGPAEVGRSFGLRNGVREAATNILFAAQEYVLTLRASGEGTQEASLLANRLSAGSEGAPVLIPTGTMHEELIGRSSSYWNNRTSYFMFRTDRAGTYSIRVFADACGASSPGVSVEIFGWHGDPFTIQASEPGPFRPSNWLASSDPDEFGSCEGQLLEIQNGTPHEPPYPYLYIRVRNNVPTSPVDAFSGRNFVNIQVTPPGGGSVVN